MSRTYHFDGPGSTVALTDETGAVTDKYIYDEWGNVTPDANNQTLDNPYQYVGRYGYYTHYQEPDFGLLQLGVRYYDPTVGRFTQRDPADDGINWYAYVDGDPVAAVDPYGLQPCSMIYSARKRPKEGRYDGSIGALVLFKDGSQIGAYSATSGRYWDWKRLNGTIPPVRWRTDGWAGNNKSNLGAYFVHLATKDPKFPEPPRHSNEFFIHGGWHMRGNVYNWSNGCIILHRKDLAPHTPIPEQPTTLADWWRKYVLDGAEHGPQSVGIPLTVEYSDK